MPVPTLRITRTLRIRRPPGQLGDRPNLQRLNLRGEPAGGADQLDQVIVVENARRGLGDHLIQLTPRRLLGPLRLHNSMGKQPPTRMYPGSGSDQPAD